MQLTKTLVLLAALTSGTLSAGIKREASTPIPTPSPSSTTSSGASSSSPSSSSGGGGGTWTDIPSGNDFSTQGFGSRTSAGGDGVSYKGNVGNPWGSNIIQISESDASKYKNVAKISGQNTEPWTVVFWNKIGPNGEMTGWYGNSALKFDLSPGDTKYVAFDDDTQGGFGASQGHLPTGPDGGYACTWGEFDFKSSGNSGWSGFDVSAIMAQNAGMPVQGMSMCDALGGTCSSITPGAAKVDNAYTSAQTAAGGIGGNISGGNGVRLEAIIDYSG